MRKKNWQRILIMNFQFNMGEYKPEEHDGSRRKEKAI
jgi:hypothetical protein